MKNMKKNIKYMFLILIIFCFILNVKAAGKMTSHSSGGTSGSGLTGSGSWNTNYVGLKVSIVSEKNVHEKTAVILNSKGEGGSKFSGVMLPKTKYSSVSWKNLIYPLMLQHIN